MNKNPLNFIKTLNTDQAFLLDKFLQALKTGQLASNKVQAMASKMRLDAKVSILDVLRELGATFHHNYLIEVRDIHGNIRDVEYLENITVNVGLDEILDKFWKGSAYTASFFVGFTTGTDTFAAGDTMASHAGWVEQAGYSESVRQTLTLGTVASQSVDNSASKVVVTASGAETYGGAFITTNNTKSGTTGILIGGAAFTSDKVLAALETLTLTVTLTAASA